MNSKIILGTVQMGLNYGVNNNIGKISEQESQLILTEAHKAGIRFLDTAEAYGNAHHVIGRYHQVNPESKFQVITKLSSNETASDIESKINQYLKDLGVDQLEVLMFHSFGSYKAYQSAIPVLQRLKDEQRFRYLGVSIYTNVEIETLIEDSNIDVIQLPFNLLDNISLRGELLQEAKSRNKIIHTRSVFLQGLFFKDPLDNHKVVQLLKNQLIQIHNLANEKNISLIELALGYCLQQQNIDQVILGVDSSEHLKSNIEATAYQLDTETIERINNIKTKNIDSLNPALWN